MPLFNVLYLIIQGQLKSSQFHKNCCPSSGTNLITIHINVYYSELRFLYYRETYVCVSPVNLPLTGEEAVTSVLGFDE